MKIQVIQKELWGYYNTPGGKIGLPSLPVYKSRLESPILFVWANEKAVRCPHKQAFGEECEFSYDVEVEDKWDMNGDRLDQYYNTAMNNLDNQIKKVIKELALEADKARIVVDEENYVRVTHFIKLHMCVEVSIKGWHFRRISAFVAEVMGKKKLELGFIDIEDLDNVYIV
jgi:hypothetical protein